MEISGRVSKGSRMDQIYIPKNRSGLAIGSYVVIKPVIEPKFGDKPCLYNLQYLEPIKLEIIKRVMGLIDDYVENVIITGSFLNKGFNFGDLDVLLITNERVNGLNIENKLYSDLGIKTHLIIINSKSFVGGLESDPLFEMMLSRCVSKKRLILNPKRKIDYRLLDLHLLKSKALIDNFDVLSGDEKYYLTRNMISLSLWIKNEKIDKELVDKKIIDIFGIKNISEIKLNMLDKKYFLKKYKLVYKEIFNKIMGGIKNESKQK